MFILIVYSIPFIPMSVKSILGILFILLSSTKGNLKISLMTATLCVLLGVINVLLGINIDNKKAILNTFLGSLTYYIIAYYSGRFTQILRDKNYELNCEIERRKKVEKELEHELILFKGLMNTIPSPIFFKDMDLKYIQYNRALEEAIGINREEAVGKTVFDIADYNHASIYQRMDFELLKQMGSQTYEDTVQFADGSLRNIIFNKSVFADANGNPHGIVGVMTDITDKKEIVTLKQNMIENTQIMEQILENDKVKTEFFSNISHELRTPLNVILGSIQLMDFYLEGEAYHDNQEKVTRNIGTIKQNCYRLLKLVNNLIDITKIDAKAFELHLENCNIVNIIEEITLSVSDYIENKGIELIFDTDIEEKIMACDAEKVERILLNLLSNAIKFTPMGGKISVNVYDRAEGICIEVKDTGIGIPADKQKQIFSRFYQADEMFTRKHEGSGIGLSLVKSLAEMHGGTASFISQEGVGTTFIIILSGSAIENKAINYTAVRKQDHVERISVEFSDIYSIRAC